MIELKVDSKSSPISWETFIKEYSGNSIALDGYVQGPANFLMSPTGTFANFNHHEGVDRLSTRATCAQILIALRQDLIESFRNDKSEIEFKVFVNDCDQDVCLSWFLLNNYWLCQKTVNPLINRLVHMEDMMDTCSGSYPFSTDMPAIKEMAWIFEPYTNFRVTGEIDKKDNRSFKNVIFDVENRIHKYLLGKGESLNLSTSYEIVGGGKNWKMVIEKGFDARSAMVQHNIKAFVSYRKRPDNNYTYSIGKLFAFFPFDLERIYTHLNFMDTVVSPENRWGGSNTIGGSPRVSGSSLTPKEVEEIINETLKVN